MKGKGKNESNAKIDISECPLHFPELKPVDHTKVCPRYTAGEFSVCDFVIIQPL